MKNTTITISQDTRRIKSDNTYPIILRLTHFEKTTAIPIGVSVSEHDWDAVNKTVKKSYKGASGVTRLNNLIQKKRSEAMDIILKLHETGRLSAMSVTDVKGAISADTKSKSFVSFTNRLIDDLIQANRVGTARSYKGVLSIVQTFHGNKDVSFRDITFRFLTNLETWHKSKGNEINGLAVYMRTIRAIYNKAIKDGMVDKENYPFTDYKIKTSPTEKRALNKDLLKNIINLPLKKTDPCFNARNYFMASYMMYGMNFTDMAFLTKDNIRDGRITYRRKKTSKLYDIKISDALTKIIDHYSSTEKYLFPIINRETPLLIAKDIQWARKRYNKKLKLLAEKCGIEQNLTSYVSRHSFATQAMLQQVPLNAISTMLGHSSLKTTEIYLKGLPSDILDNYNQLILGV